MDWQDWTRPVGGWLGSRADSGGLRGQNFERGRVKLAFRNSEQALLTAGFYLSLGVGQDVNMANNPAQGGLALLLVFVDSIPESALTTRSVAPAWAKRQMA